MQTPRTPLMFCAGTVGTQTENLGRRNLNGGPGEVVCNQRVGACFGTLGTLGRHFAAYVCARANMMPECFKPFLTRRRKTPSPSSLPSLIFMQADELKGKNFWHRGARSVPENHVSVPAVPDGRGVFSISGGVGFKSNKMSDEAGK